MYLKLKLRSSNSHFNGQQYLHDEKYLFFISLKYLSLYLHIVFLHEKNTLALYTRTLVYWY